MRLLLIATLLITSSIAPAFAGSCSDTATDKKLAGAAKTSFMKKCETDTRASCDAAATDKKIYGAAKTSFVKKCIADGIGA
jgi:hypothetical protein